MGEHIETIWRFPLVAGASADPAKGACLLGAVSWIEYGHLDDRPDCVCPVLAAYGRGINDLLGRVRRQDLRPFIPRLVGTVDPDAEEPRAAALLRHAARVVLPLALSSRDPALATQVRSMEGDMSLADLMSVVAGGVGDLRLAFRSVTERGAAGEPVRVAEYLGGPFLHAALMIVPARDLDRRDAVQRAAVEGLSAALEIGRQAGPVDPGRWEAALETFGQARERAA